MVDPVTPPAGGTPPPSGPSEESTVVVAAPAESKYSEAWKARVGMFAAAVGKSIDDITAALAGIVGEPGDDALAILNDPTVAPDADIKAALVEFKIPSGKLNMHLPKLRGAAKASESSTATIPGTAIGALDILPSVPDNTSFVEMLKTGGILKVGKTEVLSAVKAALARRVNLFELPELILERMEAFMDAQEEPCGEAFFKMQKMLTEKRYGEVLSALGVPGSFVSPRRKNEFFDRLDSKLWKALNSFQTQLTSWQQAWMSGTANPGMLILAMTSGRTGTPMPPGLMAPPDTAPLRASGEEVVNEINRVFAGPGIPVARALAYDATRIMNILNDPGLPAQLGAGTRDQMLKDLGVNVGADIVRTEQGITRYTLAIMSLKDVAPDAELAYLAALIQLGTTIPWDKLTTGASSGNGRPSGIGRPSSARTLAARTDDE